MILYLDTSALVKLYIEEVGADKVREWAANAEALATSRVALAELAAAVARRWREGDLTDPEVEAVRSAIVEDWQHFVVVDVDEHRAAEEAFTSELRGFDAIHLAAALQVRDAVGDLPVAFSCFDQRLSRAASAHGFELLDGDG